MHTAYTYFKSEITDSTTQLMLSGYYWIASRCIFTDISTAFFEVCKWVDGGDVAEEAVASGYIRQFVDSLRYGEVRPIVSMKSNIIDISNAEIDGKTPEKAWKLK